jgi:putative hemolysin
MPTLKWPVYAGRRQGASDRIDRDLFDDHCEHLVVVERGSGEVVGTYRLLLPEAAQRLGRLYSEGEFDLQRLSALRGRMLELGRSCVRSDHRSGAVIMLLWAGIGSLLAGSDARFLIGCVSVPMSDGGTMAANLYRRLASEYLAGERLRVWPRQRLDIERLENGDPVTIPALVKGYLRAGAMLLGEPHVDAQFGCADFPMMLDLNDLESRYQRRFSGARAVQSPSDRGSAVQMV